MDITAPEQLIIKELFHGGQYCAVGHLLKECGMDNAAKCPYLTDWQAKLAEKLNVKYEEITDLIARNDNIVTNEARIRNLRRWLSSRGHVMVWRNSE